MDVCSDLSKVSVDFWRFQSANHYIGPMSPTRAGQNCFLRLCDVEPQRLVLDWYQDDTFGLSNWGESLSQNQRPKGVLLKWTESGEEGPNGLLWELDDPHLQALLVDHATSMGVNPRSLSGLVNAAQQMTGTHATEFMDALMVATRRHDHRRYIGAVSS